MEYFRGLFCLAFYSDFFGFVQDTDNHNSQPVVIIEYVSDSVTSQK